MARGRFANRLAGRMLGGRALGALLGAAVLSAGVPAAAQGFSAGFKFLEAVKKKDGNTAIEMLREPGNTLVNSRDITSGKTALHIAAERQDLTWLSFLLGKHANPNIADKNGVTPLMIATQENFLEGVQALATAGAQVDTANAAGETPLISAIHQRNVPLIRTLLAAGADPDRTDNAGRTARDYAMLDGEDSTVMAELKRHDDDATGQGGKTYGPKL